MPTVVHAARVTPGPASGTRHATPKQRMVTIWRAVAASVRTRPTATVVEICCPRCRRWRSPRRFDTHANACARCKATLCREAGRP